MAGPTLPQWLLPERMRFHAAPPPGAPANALFIQLGETSLHVTDTDSPGGPVRAVVLIHGLNQSLTCWNGFTPALAQHHRVLAVDLRGCGWSGRPVGDYSPTAHARMILEALTARGVESAHIVAHSHGCAVALAMAALAPDRVSRLALYSAWAMPEQFRLYYRLACIPVLGDLLFAVTYPAPLEQRLARGFADPASCTPAIMEAAREREARPGMRAVALAMCRGLRPWLKTPLPRGLPVHLFWGQEDRVTPLSEARLLQSRLGHVPLTTYPGCGHFPMLEAPEPAVADLLSWLGHESTGRC